MRRLTEAVYDGAASDRGDAEQRPQVRVLPGPATTAILVVVLLLIAGLSVWRSLAGSATAEERTGPAPSGSPPSFIDEGDPAGDDAISGQGTDQDGVPTGGSVDAAGPTPADRGLVVVYVTGQVGAPGVVELPAGSRVAAAVTAAGGLLADADLEAINLARVVVDGEHIVVWRPGEAPEGAGEATAGDPGTGRGTGSGPAAGSAGSCVDLNTADQAALETLDGVGPALAGRILAYREQVGRIESAEHLDEVPGIGPALVARIGAGACP